MIYLALFTDTNCSFGEAILEWFLIGLGFFLFGWMLKSLFTGKNYRTELEEANKANDKLRAANQEFRLGLKEQESQIDRLKQELGEQKAKSAEALKKVEAAEKAKIEKPSVPLRAHHELKDENLQLNRKLDARNEQIKNLEPKPSNLQVIEGIGPKLEEVLHTAGIIDLDHLAQATRDQLKEILDRAGDRFRIHEPRSWPHQADLARKGETAKLKEYQEFLKGGKE